MRDPVVHRYPGTLSRYASTSGGTRVDERLDPLELVVWQKAIDGELDVGADELESVRYIVLRRLGGDVTSFRRAK